MHAEGKYEALRELAQVVHVKCKQVPVDLIFEILCEREQVGSTGVGYGVAIPHGKIPGLEQLQLCFGRSKRGISFDAIDKRPVHILVQILSPPGLADEYLQTLARISRLLKQDVNRKYLLEAESKQEILDLFNRPNQ